MNIPKVKCPECGARIDELAPGPFGSLIPAIVDDGDQLHCLRCKHRWERSQGH